MVPNGGPVTLANGVPGASNRKLYWSFLLESNTFFQAFCHSEVSMLPVFCCNMICLWNNFVSVTFQTS